MNSNDSPPQCERCLRGAQHPLYFCVAADHKRPKAWRASVSLNPVVWARESNDLHHKRAKKPAANEPDRFSLVLVIGPFETPERVQQVRAAIDPDSLVKSVNAVSALGGQWYCDNVDDLRKLVVA